MTLEIKTVNEISGTVTYVSGGGSVASGGVYEAKFSEYEKVENALPQLGVIYDEARKTDIYEARSALISGNVVAVQLHKMRNVVASGEYTSGLWVPCLSGDLSAISGVITVIADCI